MVNGLNNRRKLSEPKPQLTVQEKILRRESAERLQKRLSNALISATTD